MKKSLLFIIFLLCQFFLQAQTITIPDANFKSALLGLGVDKSNDNEIQVSEAEGIHILYLTMKHIDDLTGIEYFTNLDTLICNQNQLTTLNLTKNIKLIQLSCAMNNLTALDLSKNTELKYILCSMNNLSKLNISSCIALETLYCTQTQIEKLDLSKNTKLKLLVCQESLLTELDVTKNTKLESLDCRNTLLYSLNVINNTLLYDLKCSDNTNLSLVCINSKQELYLNGWQKDQHTTFSSTCDIVATGILHDSETPKPKVLDKVFTITGAEVNESDAHNGIYIYIYTDGSRMKIAKP